MYLLIINLYELGQFLRILLWIGLPASIVWMLVTSFLQYRRSWREQSGLRLAIEGGAGFDGPGPGGYVQGPRGYSQGPGGYGLGVGGYGPMPGGPDGPENPADEMSEMGSRREDEDFEWNEGNENMYRGILWMKEKYEQYRELTDQRYERLREELGRSERRYQDLLLTIEESRGAPAGVGQASGVAQTNGVGQVGGAGQARGTGQTRAAGQARGAGQPHGGAQSHEGVERAYGVEEPHPYDLLAGELNAKQAVIEELEEQLRVERLRVEELIFKLQTNGQLLQQIYIELDKSYGMARPSASQE